MAETAAGGEPAYTPGRSGRAPHRTGLRIGAVTLAAVVFVFWGQPTVAVALSIVILLLVVLGLIQLIGRPPSGPQPAGLPGGG